MNALLQDFRFGLRQLRKNPGFTAITVLTLSLGIGVNIAAFSFVDEIWLHPMPVRQPDRLVRIFTSNPSSEGEIERGYSSYPDFQDLRTSSKSLAGVAALDRRGALVDDGTQNRLVTAAVVSENFFDVLQATPALGRMFNEADFKSSPSPSVVLSYPFWQRQFNSDRAIAGRSIIVDTRNVTVLGVLPRGFRGTDVLNVSDLWIPMATWQQLVGERDKQTRRGSRDYELFGRLRNDVSLSQARAELETFTAALANAYPASNVGRKMTLVPEAQTRTGVANTGLALLGIATLVLLVACANVASLLLAHGESRRKEIATRLALGGSRAVLIRQFLAETALLALLATLMALLLGNFALDALPRLLPQTSIPMAIDAHLNLRAFLFALATGVVSLLFFGLLPALQTTNLSPVAVLKQSGIQTEARRTRFRSALTVAQIALSLVMVVCSGLLVRSVLAALALDPGFNAHQNMLIMELVPAFGSKNPQESVAFVREARQQFEALPGVVATTIALHFPFGMSGGGATRKVFLPGTLSETEGVTINSDLIGSDYFSVLGARILRGRAIDQHDVDMKAHVLVVNQSLAHRFWPKQDAIGNRVRLSAVNGTEYEIIGVAEDGKYNDVREDRTPLIYLPLSDDEDYGELAMAVKTKMDPESLAPLVRQTLREIKREVPILALVTLREHMREALYEQRVIAGAIGGMGALGVILAAIGIYGLMAFLVRRRTPEIGIRMALGARREGILWLVLRHSLFLTTIGAAIGTAGAIAAAQGLRSLLFGVAPTDVVTIATAIAVLAIVAIMAAAVPALKAAKVDPMVALRYE